MSTSSNSMRIFLKDIEKQEPISKCVPKLSQYLSSAPNINKIIVAYLEYFCMDVMNLVVILYDRAAASTPVL